MFIVLMRSKIYIYCSKTIIYAIIKVILYEKDLDVFLTLLKIKSCDFGPLITKITLLPSKSISNGRSLLNKDQSLLRTSKKK